MPTRHWRRYLIPHPWKDRCWASSGTPATLRFFTPTNALCPNEGPPGKLELRISRHRATRTRVFHLLDEPASEHSPPDTSLRTLNPPHAPRAGTLHHSETYEHPIFDAQAVSAQRRLWELQGVQRTWFCGAYFGYGFHEDGLQAGLAVAEQLGGVRRPWTVPNGSGRISIDDRPGAGNLSEVAR